MRTTSFAMTLLTAVLSACASEPQQEPGPGPLSPAAAAPVAPPGTSEAAAFPPGEDLEEHSGAQHSSRVHRIQVRQTSSGGELYDTLTGAAFVARGNNYIRLGPVNDPWQGEVVYHSTFDAYEPQRAELALTQMQEYGYNVVRVFVDEATVGDPAGAGLSRAYVANVVDFLWRARTHGIYVMLTLPFLPRTATYVPAPSPSFSGFNTFQLHPEAVAAKGRYVQDFILLLMDLDAPLDIVLSYNIENEVFFTENDAPLSFQAGTVRTANGADYDMASAVDRQQMMDANLVYWIDSVRAAARAVDPTALVAPGFFSPLAVTGADLRVIRTHWALAEAALGGSSADFIDLHVYPHFGTLEAQLAAFEIGESNKPLIIGELGVSKGFYADRVQSAFVLRDWQVETCLHHRISGWLFWTWDTTEQPEFYNLLESSGAMNGVLAPIARPDPCAR